MSEPSPTSPTRTLAIVRAGRWPGWIWSVPLATIGIVVWLLVRQLSQHGVEITIDFDQGAEMDPDSTKVIERGVQVGKVREVQLSEDGMHVHVTLNIDDREKKFLNAGTRFYLEGAKPELSDLSTLKAIVGGPSIRMLPGGGAPSRHFVGIVGEAPERLAVAVPYWMTFTGDAGGLKVGAPVVLKGFTVGEVTSMSLRTDAAQGSLDTRVGIALDPLRFHIEDGTPAAGDWTAVMNATLGALVAHGLRARLSQSPPVVGAAQIELAQIPQATPAKLVTMAGEVQMPTAEGGGLDRLIGEINAFPLQQIGDNVRAITQQVRSLTADPQLRASVQHLNESLSQLDQTLKQVGPQISPAVQSARDAIDRLRQTAGDLDQAAKAAQATLGTDLAAPEGSLEPTLLHVSEAARSIRILADYLDAHPEALVRGRVAAASKGP